MRRFELALEAFLFKSRWLLLPFLLGLIVAIVVLLLKFLGLLVAMVAGVLAGGSDEILLDVLTLLDTTLIAILLVIVVLSGYENFVSRMTELTEHEDRPAWMQGIGFSDLKIKMIGAMVAISAVELLKAFINIEAQSTETLGWRVGIHLTFVASGVLFALSDRLSKTGSS